MAIPYNSEAIGTHDITGTLFQIGYLDASESAYLDEAFSKIQLVGEGEQMVPKIHIDISGKQLEAVRLKLKGAENFGEFKFGYQDKQYPFGRRRVLNDASLNAVKPYIAEIGQAIINQSSLSEQAEKN